MNLSTEILQEHSKQNTLHIAQWIGNDRTRFEHLMQLFLGEEKLIVQRSAWVLSTCADAHPQLVMPYLSQMIEQCRKEGIHDAVKRNVTRVLHQIEIPENHYEAVLNMCFDFLCNPKETVAVRCWSMGILTKIALIIPDIKNELVNIIEDALEHQELSAGFISKSKRSLKKLK